MTHWPDSKVDIRHSLEVMKKAQDAGKIKSIGMCNTNLEELEKAKEVCTIEYIQSECNLFSNQIEHLEDYCHENNIKTMGWGTFDKGILAGTVKIDRKFDEYDCRSWAPWWKKSNWKDKVKKVESMSNFSESIFDLALQYSLQNSDYSLCGFKNLTQLEGTLNSSLKDINPDIIQQAAKFARS
jgi:aryl-alcohol dehydrogenase-like predicted oxidoreductase